MKNVDGHGELQWATMGRYKAGGTVKEERICFKAGGTLMAEREALRQRRTETLNGD